MAIWASMRCSTTHRIVGAGFRFVCFARTRFAKIFSFSKQSFFGYDLVSSSSARAVHIDSQFHRRVKDRNFQWFAGEILCEVLYTGRCNLNLEGFADFSRLRGHSVRTASKTPRASCPPASSAASGGGGLGYSV